MSAHARNRFCESGSGRNFSSSPTERGEGICCTSTCRAHVLEGPVFEMISCAVPIVRLKVASWLKITSCLLNVGIWMTLGLTRLNVAAPLLSLHAARDQGGHEAFGRTLEIVTSECVRAPPIACGAAGSGRRAAKTAGASQLPLRPSPQILEHVAMAPRIMLLSRAVPSTRAPGARWRGRPWTAPSPRTLRSSPFSSRRRPSS